MVAGVTRPTVAASRRLPGGFSLGFGVDLGDNQHGQAGEVKPEDEDDHAGEAS